MYLYDAIEVVNKAIKNDATDLNLDASYTYKYLYDTDIKILLPEILQLKSLTSLNLRGNKISDVSFLKGLKSLTSLDLSSNEISDISFLKGLKSLTSLYLSDNQISDISFLKELKSLTLLKLGANQISDVSFLKELKSLKGLNLVDNEINDYLFLKELKSLAWLHLGGNPNLNLPKKIRGKSILNRSEIDEITKYYEQLESGKDYIYEAKVQIVGEPNAGKTTLFRKLQDSRYLPQEATEAEKESTIGVDINILEFSFDDDKNFKAHLWDFGGQEKQYVLHQYFFTERSLYILLADDRAERTNFNYWFEIIATLGSGCPVLVVLNEVNSKVKNFDLLVYKKEFGEKIQVIEEKSVNFANNDDGRFTNLVNEIKTKLKNLPHIGQPLPKTWVKVREELEKVEEPLVSIDVYRGICERCGVKEEYRSQILEYLHDLGIALNYKNDDNLRNKLILKPNWVIDALYAVLKDENIIGNAGKFSADDVFALWNAYNSDEQTILLQLMQKGKFEVAYKLEGKNAYIAPILLPEIAPEYSFDDADSLQIHFDYAFKPKGIISRLIVRLHENIAVNEETGKQIVWKKGVLLKHKDSTARIIESEQRRKITITVSGKSASENREFITIVSNEIKKIHRDWFENRLQFVELIPCYCDVCQTETEPQFYELETVQSYYEINQPIMCDKSVKARKPQSVNPQKLLEGIYIEDKQQTSKNSFGQGNTFHIAGDLNLSVKDARIIIQEVDGKIKVGSNKLNESQKQMMEKFADEVVARIVNKLDDKEKEALEKGSWETKLELSLPFVPLKFERKITPNEFIGKVRKWLYGGDLEMNILQAEAEAKGFLSE